MPSWWLYPVCAAFIASLILTDALRRVAVRFNWLDRPNKERKKHAGAIPTVGGLAIFLAFAVAVAITGIRSSHFTSGEITIWHLIGFVVGGAVLVVGGLLDDRFDLKPQVSILFPVTATIIAIAGGIGVSKITNPFGGAFELLPVISDAMVFIWLMVMMYTTKLLDGLDGLAGGVTAIGAMMIALLALSDAYFQPDVALLSLIAVAAILGFLVWNFPPAHVYLGEGGSTFVGYLLGTLAVISGGKVATALLVVGVPAFDILFVMMTRLKMQRSIFEGDRSHLHHRLYDLGLKPRQVIALYYAVALIFGLTTLIFESWQKLAALGGLFLALALLVNFLAHRRPV